MFNNNVIQKSKYKILIIDDDVISCNLTAHLLDQKGFVSFKAHSGEDGLKMATEILPHLILLDKRMPKMDGFETLAHLQKNSDTRHIPVIFLTGEDNEANEVACFEKGAQDFIRKPIVPDVMIQRILRIIEHQALLNDLEYIVSDRTSELREEEEHRRRLSDQIITALALAVDAKDEYTNGHSKRVAEYATRIADILGKDDAYKEELHYLGMLHDIGKIGIPDEIIHKTTRLTDDEYDTIRRHPVIGARILETIQEIPTLSIGARYHHERFDGTGYPDGLKGYEIPEQARILSVADSYDAMTSTRAYHSTSSQEYARSELIKGKGTQFDPEIADAMIQLIDEDTDYTMKAGTRSDEPDTASDREP